MTTYIKAKGKIPDDQATVDQHIRIYLHFMTLKFGVLLKPKPYRGIATL